MKNNNLTPDVSIIVPVYNVEKYLRECLDSLVEQEGLNLEIIMVNDGSTDNSRTIAKEFADKYDMFTLIDQENEGVSVARNVGLKQASGKYIAYIDSDDVMQPGMLKKAFDICEADELDVLRCSITNFFDDEVSETMYGDVAVDQYALKEEYPDSVISGAELGNTMIANNEYIAFVWCNLIRRDFHEKYKLRFIEGIEFEDGPYDMALYAYARRTKVMKDSLIKYRIRNNSIVHRPPTIGKCNGAYKGLLGMIDAAVRAEAESECDNKEELKAFLGSEVGRRFRFTARAYRELSPEDQAQAIISMGLSPKEELFFNSMIARFNMQIATTQKLREKNKKFKDKNSELSAEIKELKKDNKSLKKELKQLRNSKAFKIGRLVTAPYRLIKK